RAWAVRSRPRALRRIRQVRPDRNRAHPCRARPPRFPRRMAARARRRLGGRPDPEPHQSHPPARKGVPTMTICRSRPRAIFMAATLLAAPLALSPMLASPAHAQFGFGRIVYDPSNYAQNVLTAARTLEQINNQIQSLQNEA